MLSQSSVQRLRLLHPKLRAVVENVARDRPIQVVCTFRDQIEQEAAYKAKRSKAQWLQSPHNYAPALAVDLAPLIFINGKPDIPWNDFSAFKALAGHVKAVAFGHGVHIRWGADWDMDNLTKADGDTDEKFVDAPHFELADWKVLVGLARAQRD